MDKMSIKLIFEDEDRIIEFKVDATKLQMIPYFQKMAAFKKKGLDIISVTVPNAYVAYDVVKFITKNKVSNYGNLSKWRHILESHICYEYFGMDYEPDLTDSMPRKYFQLLIEVFETTRNGHVYGSLICSTLKANLDLIARISKDTLLCICDIAQTYYVLNRKRLTLSVWNSKQQDDVYSGDIDMPGYESLVKLFFDLNTGFNVITTDKYIFYDSWVTPKIIEISTQKTVFELYGGFSFLMCFSSSGLCAYTYGRNIDIYDIGTGTIITSVKIHHLVKTNGETSKLFFTHDGHIILLIDEEESSNKFPLLLIDSEYNVKRIRYKQMDIYRMCAGATTFQSFDDHPVAYSHDLKMMAIGSDKNVNVIDLPSGKVVKQLIGHTDKITYIRYSPDDSQIITTSLDLDVRIWSGEETIKVLNNFLIKENSRAGIGNHLCFVIPDNYDLILQIRKTLSGTKN
uniref:Uncharacterized protein n=1 Tax=viral metagenome TaxID=1070528 RepID=A0A6C0C8B7_9ZZZZ